MGFRTVNGFVRENFNAPHASAASYKTFHRKLSKPVGWGHAGFRVGRALDRASQRSGLVPAHMRVELLHQGERNEVRRP